MQLSLTVVSPHHALSCAFHLQPARALPQIPHVPRSAVAGYDSWCRSHSTLCETEKIQCVPLLVFVIISELRLAESYCGG